MTELNNVSIKVIDDARSVRSEIIKEAEEKAAGILAEASRKAGEIIERAKSDAREHYKRTLEMEIFRARSALDQKVLLTKLELVEDVIEKAKGRLSGLDRKGWEKFLKKMAREQGIEEGKYTIGKEEKILDDSLAGIIKGIKPDKRKADFDRGLKIIMGKTELLLSPENYLDMDVEDLKMDIALYLFDGGKW